MVSIEDGLKFIRSHYLLLEWTDESILDIIRQAILNKAFSYTLNNKGELNGIVIGKWINPCTIHIITIYGELKPFLVYLKNIAPWCHTITGIRHNRNILYEPTDFQSLLN